MQLVNIQIGAEMIGPGDHIIVGGIVGTVVSAEDVCGEVCIFYRYVGAGGTENHGSIYRAPEQSVDTLMVRISD